MKGTSESQLIVFLEGQVEKQHEILEELRNALQAKDKELEAYKDALSPSADTKCAYHGEISWLTDGLDEDGEDDIVRVYMPWTKMKEFMTLIRVYAKSRINRKE